jgi:hypothetical protein
VTLFGASGGVMRRRGAGWKGLVIAFGLALASGLSMPSAEAAPPVDALLRVRIKDAAGAPVAGARVLTTVLWTSKADFERHGRPRGQIHRADDVGRLVVPIRLDREQRAAVARNGDWANISVTAIDSVGQPIAQATTSRYVGTQPDQRARARSMPHAEVVRLVQRQSGFETRSLDTSAQSDITSCTYYWDAGGYANRYAQVGELHVDWDVPFARFTYGSTADTTFDVASKSATGVWTITGGVHVHNTLSTSVFASAGGQTNYHWALRTQFRFVNMKLFKDCLGGPYGAWVGPQEVHALEWTGGGMTLANTLNQPARQAANTSTYGPNTGWARSTGTLVKWYANVSAFGALLGAQSGASNNVDLGYAFGNRRTHYLYGDTSLPTTSKRVFQDTP